MKQCSLCDFWNKGKGEKLCLRCSQYKRFQIKSVPRSQIPIDLMPDILMESIADISPECDILDAIQRLPNDLSAIISMYYISNISIHAIASIMQISETSARRKKDAALAHIKKMFLKENT